MKCRAKKECLLIVKPLSLMKKRSVQALKRKREIKKAIKLLKKYYPKSLEEIFGVF
jgi:hypothetical protein